MMKHVWTRTYDTHITLQYIDKLRELINVCLSHEVAKGKLSRIVLGCLSLVSILIHMHGTELQTVESITIQTRSSLLEEDRTRTLHFDDKRDDRNERQDTKTDDTTYYDIESSLDKTVRKTGQWFKVVGINRSSHEITGIKMQFILTEHTRQIIKMHYVFITEAHNLHYQF